MEFGFEPASNQLRTSSEPASVMEFGFYQHANATRSISRTSAVHVICLKTHKHNVGLVNVHYQNHNQAMLNVLSRFDRQLHNNYTK